MSQTDIKLIAHLMRRAGFGAARDELDAYAAKGYEATVEGPAEPEVMPSGSATTWSDASTMRRPA